MNKTNTSKTIRVNARPHTWDPFALGNTLGYIVRPIDLIAGPSITLKVSPKEK